MGLIFRTVIPALLLASAPQVPRAHNQQLQAPDLQGAWCGKLNTPARESMLVVSIRRGLDGTLRAELESPDQAPDQKTSKAEIEAEDNTFHLNIRMIHATFVGHWNTKKDAWDGTFTQGSEMPLTLTKCPAKHNSIVPGLDGIWYGKIRRNGIYLRLVLHVLSTPEGTVGILDSPDQLSSGLPVQNIIRDGSDVTFNLKLLGVNYEGKLTKDLQHLIGNWNAPNQPPAQVDFVRADRAASSTPKHPQTPRPPFPYSTEEVAFDNPFEKGVHLAGTLTLPMGKGPFSAAILITGSGQQDRDGTVLGHKPFAVIADYLTRHGIAVLRVDDRGVGASTGEVDNATSADFATDANAAFAFLHRRQDIRTDSIGFIGHSEGGMIGPIAMSTNSGVAFLIMLAGPGMATQQLLLAQRRALAISMGSSEDEVAHAQPVMASLFKALASGATLSDGLAAARAVLTPDALSTIGVPPGGGPQSILKQLGTPWFRYFVRYDPARNLRRIKVPVLAMNGSLDRQVLSTPNLAAIHAALKNNRDVTIVELPGLNHFFQTAGTGAPGEYADIEETFSPVALEHMSIWLNERFKK